MDTQPVSPTVRIIAFFGILAVAMFGLVFVYRLIPSRDEAGALKNATAEAPPWTRDPDRVACETARGLWTECGDSCRGSTSSTCVSVCERQCVCGGVSQWTCPNDLSCGRLVTLQGLGVVGVCEKPEAVTTATSTQEHLVTPIVPEALFPMPQGMVCSENRTLCMPLAWKEATFTWPLKLKGIVQGDVQEAYWSMMNTRGTVVTGSLTITQKNASTTIWAINVPRPSGWQGTSRVDFYIGQTLDVILSSSTVGFDIFVK